jgi:hypothetical protein
MKPRAVFTGRESGSVVLIRSDSLGAIGLGLVGRPFAGEPGAGGVLGGGPLPGGHLGLFLGMLVVKAALCLAQACAAGVGVSKIGRQLVAAGLAVGGVLGLVDPGGLLEDLGGELGVGAVGLIGGVGGDPGAVEGDRADRDQAGLRAETEDVAEELGQGLGVAGPKARDRRVVGDLVRGDHAVGDVLLAAALDPPRRALAGRVGVEHQGDHHRRIVGCSAPAVVAVGGVEGLQVDLIDGVQDEPGEVVIGEPLAQVGGHQ